VLLPDQPLSILCVDDEVNILNSLRRLFHKEPFRVLTASSGKEGLALLKQTENIGMILSDHRMPGMSGTEFLHEAAELSPDSYRMLLTGYADMDTAIQAINQAKAIHFQTKPWDDEELLRLVREGLQRYRTKREKRQLQEMLTESNATLGARLLQQTENFRAHLGNTRLQHDRNFTMNESIVSLLAELLDQCHYRLSKHSRNVAALATSMVTTLNLPESQREEIGHAALLHDIGLIGVSDRMLMNNMELLSGNDASDYQDHPVRGQKLLRSFKELDQVGWHIRHHHEAFDGSGFPDGLAGEEISLGGRIIHLASFIDNSYGQPVGIDAKYQMDKKVIAGLGTNFDPDLYGAANRAIMEVLSDSTAAPTPANEQKIHFTSLQVGMVLVNDILDSSGSLFMGQGTRLTPEHLRTIRSRQHMDLPISMVSIRRSTC